MPEVPGFDRTFFGLLDQEERKRRELMLVNTIPWTGVSEDRERVHDVLRAKYASIGLPAPKPCWARSPYAMFGALTLLRQMQTASRQEAIKSIVPATENPLDAEVKRVFLEGAMDRDITVTMGANMREQLFRGKPSSDPPQSIVQLARLLAGRFTPPPTPGFQSRAAGWSDWVIYPMSIPFSYDLQAQTFCFVAFAKCAWLCRPPVVFNVDDDGNFVYARFEDGFEIERKRKPEPEAKNRLTNGEEPLALPAPEDETE